jgi:hypothetical protein
LDKKKRWRGHLKRKRIDVKGTYEQIKGGSA